MRLGIISTVSGYFWAGSEEMWKLIAEQAIAASWNVFLSARPCIARSPELDALKRLGMEVVERPDVSRLTRALAERGFYSRFRGFKHNRFDVLCVSMGGPADCYWEPDLLDLLQSTKVRLVIIVQGNAEGFVTTERQRRILAAIFQKAERCIFVAAENLRLLERQLATPLPNAVVIPNPLRHRVEAPLPWPEHLDHWSFAMVARLEALHKCQDQLLQALSARHWQDRNWTLTLYGTGPDREYVERLCRMFELNTRVHLAGWVRDYRQIWADHHIHVLMSHSEGLSLALIESMSCGRPAIVTHAGGHASLVRDGVEGFVSPGMHPEVIQDTLDRAWTHRDSWKQMGKAAFERAIASVPENLGEILLEQVRGSF